MTVLHVAAIMWALGVLALVMMVAAHAPAKTVAEILHDAEQG